MNNLVNTKSVLAKLMAGENITVVHRNTPTAYFDLKSRTLVCPIWEAMDGPMYDLIMGHEVGHALETPQEGWHTTIHEKGKGFKSYLNVIEDARIEKKIKRKYPGLAKSFATAYAEFYERDFFGIKKLDDLNKLNLIDRINIHFKLGSHVIVPFNDTERDIIRRVQNAETWNEVVTLATLVYDYVKENEQDKINDDNDLIIEVLQSEDFNSSNDSDDFDDDDLDDGGYEGDFSDSSEESEDESDDHANEKTDGSGEYKSSHEDSEKDDSSSDESSDENSSNEEKNENSESDQNDSDEKNEGQTPTINEHGGEDVSDNKTVKKNVNKETSSVTDNTFREREKELVVNDHQIFTYSLPTPILENIILPVSKVVADFEKVYAFIDAKRGNHYYNSVSSDDYVDSETLIKGCIAKFKKNDKFISMLLKEFEMRKNASQYSRSQVARSGELDMNKLDKYRFTNDIFRKIKVVPKGKSHGLMMFVDMSGSMSNIFGPTVEQMLILSTFCKKANIPFDVYGFSDDYYIGINDYHKANKFNHDPEMVVQSNNFHLKHMLSSSLNKNMYHRAFKMLCVLAMNYRNESFKTCLWDWTEYGFGLHGTPFTQTLLASRDMIEKFKAANKVDITNVIYLTDGMGGSCMSDAKSNYAWYANEYKKEKKTIYLIDPKTKQRCVISPSSQQEPVTEFIRKLTDCKHIGYYLIDKREQKYVFQSLKGTISPIELDKSRKSYRENNFFKAPALGYDNFYYIKINNKNVAENDESDYEFDETMTNRKMAKVFIDAQLNKRKNRLLISQFTQEIAE